MRSGPILRTCCFLLTGGEDSALSCLSQTTGQIFHTSPFARHIYKDRGIPTVPAYSQMMFQIARAVRRETPGQRVAVAFYIDKSSDAEKIQNAHRAIKINHPTIGKSLVYLPVPLHEQADACIASSRPTCRHRKGYRIRGGSRMAGHEAALPLI